MDSRIVDIARQLQIRVEGLDAKAERETLIWIHGLLTGMLDRIEAQVPSLSATESRDTSGEFRLAERQSMAKLREAAARDVQRLLELAKEDEIEGDDSDSLEQIARDLEDEEERGEAPVPATRKPGPKGLRGGASVDPFAADRPM